MQVRWFKQINGVLSVFAAVSAVIVSTLSAPTAHAQPPTPRPRVLLITSLALPPIEQIPSMYRSYFQSTKFRVEKTFRQFFEREDVELSVLHDADAYQTWRALKSPGNVAVFWFSHAGAGALGGATLQDRNGNNVLPVFQAMHPDTQLLAFVGCDTKAVYENMKDQDYFKASPAIQLIGTDPRAEATHAFEQALAQSLAGIRRAARQFNPAPQVSTEQASCAPRLGYPITLRRDLDPTIARDQTTSPVIVTLGGKLVTVFEPARAGEGQQQTVAWVQPPAGGKLRAAQLKLAFDGGSQAMQEPRWIGDFEIQASWPTASWEVFAKKGSNAPIGVSTRVFRYSGALDFAQTLPPTSVTASDCEAAELPIVAKAMRSMPQRFGRARVEAGAGMASGDELGGSPLWARISIGGRSGRYKQLAVAYGQLSAEGIINLDATTNRIPFLDLRLTAISAGRSEHDGEHMGIRLGAVQVSRDMPLDEERVIRVDIMGIQSQVNRPFKMRYDPSRTAYLSVAADLIGFKTVERLREGADFNGLHLVSSRTEGGIIQRLGERIQVRGSVGMESDISFGFKEGWSPTVYSKFKFYAQVRADIDNLLRTVKVSAFAEAQAPIVKELGEDTESELRLIGGLLIAH